MEKEAIVQIYKKIYFVKKNNVIETVYKYQEVLTGIIVTLDNGNKVFKDSNNNIFPCLNNDTLILQDDFSTRVINEYKKNKYGVLGPKIILKNNVVNSLYLNLPTYTQIKYK